MVRGRQIQPASSRPVAVWRAERVVASVLVKNVNSGLEQFRETWGICHKALPLAEIRCNMEESIVSVVSRSEWDCGRKKGTGNEGGGDVGCTGIRWRPLLNLHESSSRKTLHSPPIRCHLTGQGIRALSVRPCQALYTVGC